MGQESGRTELGLLAQGLRTLAPGQALSAAVLMSGLNWGWRIHFQAQLPPVGLSTGCLSECPRDTEDGGDDNGHDVGDDHDDRKGGRGGQGRGGQGRARKRRERAQTRCHRLVVTQSQRWHLIPPAMFYLLEAVPTSPLEGMTHRWEYQQVGTPGDHHTGEP